MTKIPIKSEKLSLMIRIMDKKEELQKQHSKLRLDAYSQEVSLINSLRELDSNLQTLYKALLVEYKLAPEEYKLNLQDKTWEEIPCSRMEKILRKYPQWKS